jgi:hypothetical protein
MTSIFPVFFLLLFIATPALTQTPDERQVLQKQILPLLEQGKLADVVKIAEKIVKLEKQGGEKNIANYAAALQNLARWKDQFLTREGTRLSYYKRADLRLDTFKHFEEAHELAKKAGDPIQLAMAQSELAGFMLRNNGSWPQIEELLVRSLGIRDQQGELDAPSTLALLDKLAAGYLQHGEYEKFIPVNRRLVASLEKKEAQDKKTLLAPLKRYADFLATTDRRTEVEEVLKRIVGIEGVKYEPIRGPYILLRRAAKIDLIFGEVPSSGMNSGVSADSRLSVPTGISSNKTNTPGFWVREQRRQGDVTTLKLNVLIDEAGKVVEANFDPELIVDKKIVESVRRRALTWTFKPFVYEGKHGKKRSRIKFYVFLEQGV